NGLPAREPGQEQSMQCAGLGWPLSSLLRSSGRRAEDDGTVFLFEVRARDALHLFFCDGQETVEYRIHELRLAVEQSEAGEQVHQAIFRHVATAAAFQRGEIIRAPLDLELLQFGVGNSLLLDFLDDGIKLGEG